MFIKKKIKGLKDKLIEEQQRKIEVLLEQQKSNGLKLVKKNIKQQELIEKIRNLAEENKYENEKATLDEIKELAKDCKTVANSK